MSMADNIKKGIQKKKEGFSSEQEVRELINTAATKALRQFVQRMDAGEIPLDNVSDFIRVIGAYKEINGINDAMEGISGQGALPEINMKQDKVLEDHIQEGKVNLSEEGTLDVMDLSAEDVSNMLRDLDIAQNQENEGGF